MSASKLVAFLSATVMASAIGVADMTGTWYLNLQKSNWGSRPKPVSVMLVITHTEPNLTYTGSVMYAGEDTRPFGFSGAIDGKGYPMDRSFGSGSAVLRRIDAHTFQSIFRTYDGNTEETTETSISSDGRTLTRRIRLRSQGVTSKSTELYERR